MRFIIGGHKLIDNVKIDLRDANGEILTVWIDVFDNSLSRKWLSALDDLLKNQNKLEKNYCFLGFADSARDGSFICDQINLAIDGINHSGIGYQIDDYFKLGECLHDGPAGPGSPGGKKIQDRFNNLHRYFEDLQGVSGRISEYYQRADDATRWHIRQLNLLCHEFESWALSHRKKHTAPEWQRPSQLMCWLNAPRFTLGAEDYELFGIDTIARPMGGVFVGVNKAVGKHHWEVFHDEGRDSRIGELVTSTLRSQTEAAGDFDIEWAQDPAGHPWMHSELKEFRNWLKTNGFDPDDPSLTIGHPQCGQVDLERSFGTQDYKKIWAILENHMDVVAVETGRYRAEYLYHWSDADYIQTMIGKK